MVDYIGQFIVLVAALIAIRGGTWDVRKTGIRKFTLMGWLALVTAAAGLSTSIITIADAKQTTNHIIDQGKIANLKLNTALADLRVSRADAKITKEQLQETIKELKVARKDLRAVYQRSDRYNQIVGVPYVQLRPMQNWNAPNQIYGGTFIKLHGFPCNLKIWYGPRSKIISSQGFSGYPKEIAIEGPSGRMLRWGISNLDAKHCSGKLEMRSTPRIRSRGSSSREETSRP